MNLKRFSPFKYLILLSFFFGQAKNSQAEDDVIQEINTLTGKVYLKVKITKILPNEIGIMHESGVARIPITEVPEELRIKLGCDLKSKIKKAASAYDQLWEIKLRPGFHKDGFMDEAAKDWLDSVRSLRIDTELNNELLSKGVALADLEVLATEWRKSKGLDTQASSSFVSLWDKALGVKREKPEEPSLWDKALGVKREKPEEQKAEDVQVAKNKPKPNIYGIWKMRDRSLLVDKIYLYEEKGVPSGIYSFINGEKLKFTLKESESAVGWTFKIVESPSGDYIRITDLGTLELCDGMGVINTGRK
jgi:hypothetical protein